VPLPDLSRKLAPARPKTIGREIRNALGRLEAERPKLADACEPASMGKLVSLVLDAIDQECRWHYGLWTLDERRKHLKVWSVLRPDGVDIGMLSDTGSGGYQREPAPWIERTKRKEELLQLPWIMEMVERVVLHAYAILRERGAHVSELVPGGRRIKGAGYARITFFVDDDDL
jgi:hypothetical protein